MCILQFGAHGSVYGLEVKFADNVIQVLFILTDICLFVLSVTEKNMYQISHYDCGQEEGLTICHGVVEDIEDSREGSGKTDHLKVTLDFLSHLLSFYLNYLTTLISS